MNTVKTLPGFGWVIGVTCLCDSLFVLFQRDDKQVEVYSTKTSEDFKRLDLFSVEGLCKDKHNDMTSCVLHMCLYFSDHSNKCIHMTALNGAVRAKWPLPNSPRGLSLTPSGNLLVTCPESRTLLEMCSESGKCIRKVSLPPNIDRPYHTIELHGATETHHCVISHSTDERSKVSVIGIMGQVSLSYGHQSRDDVSSLVFARHMTTDKHNFVFVADRENTGVVLISPGVQYVRHIQLEQKKPTRLCLDHSTRRLYVGHLDGVTVVQT